MSIAEEHANKLKFICENKNIVLELKATLEVLSTRRENETDIFSMLDLDDQINQITTQIDKLETDDQNTYLLRISSIIHDYDYSLNEDFTSKSDGDACDLNTFVEQRTNSQRGKLYSQYMNVVNNVPLSSIRKNSISICTGCKSNLKLAANESYVVCETCGHFEVYFEPSASGLTYEQEVNTDTNIHFSYKRINHLRELLSQLQAKESSDVPDDVLNIIRAEFKKERVHNMNEVSQDKVKRFLKKCNLTKYYEHTRQITNILSGKPPPTISNELYDKIITMFIEIQEPFERSCPKTRKNFFSYNYILFKFCELLEAHEHMHLFPLLKSREKLYQQDCIWKDICDIKGWCYIKSV
jgi:predicted RNA-binding Zn-ribbon protein involved in translation (DUF1610 family)